MWVHVYVCVPQSIHVEVRSQPQVLALLNFPQASWPMSFLEYLLSLPPISAPSTGGTDTYYHAQLFMGSVDPKILNSGRLPGTPSALPPDLFLNPVISTTQILSPRPCD